MEHIKKFQGLLAELFQFDAADLDFGIYRILNYKRDQINSFINEDLARIADEAFAKYRDERLDNIEQVFEEAKQKVSQTLGSGAFLPTGDLKGEFRDTPVGRTIWRFGRARTRRRLSRKSSCKSSTISTTSSPGITTRGISRRNTATPSGAISTPSRLKSGRYFLNNNMQLN
jgi:hypothetical protein